jgi:hypothetical protein
VRGAGGKNVLALLLKTSYGEQVFTCLAKPVQPLDLIDAVKDALGHQEVHVDGRPSQS